MLEVSNLAAQYGAHPALQDASLSISAGEIVVILGANGAGKSTLLRCIAGICEGEVSGSVRKEGHSLAGLSPDQIVEQGIALVPEGRGIFADLTVGENLLLGAHSQRARQNEKDNLARVFALFPKLQEREKQTARTMSGGEQQMVAIGRALMSNPEILLLDEPSLGLSPLLCKELFKSLASVRATGIGILLVEQNAKQSLAIADRAYLLENTRIVREDLADRMINDPAVQQAYLGGAIKAGSTGTASDSSAETEARTLSPRAEPFTASPATQQTAEQLTGISIDDLVVQAESKSVAPREAAVPVTVPDGTRHRSEITDQHQHQLRATLNEIEHAATAARKRHRQDRSSSLSNDKASARASSSGTKADEKPVVIEVYRPPRVEVYRRRPGSTDLQRE